MPAVQPGVQSLPWTSHPRALNASFSTCRNATMWSPPIVPFHVGHAAWPGPCRTGPSLFETAITLMVCRNLQGVDLQRVTSAHALYHLVGRLAKICYNKGILLCIQNPARSIFWLVSAMQPCRARPCESAFLHHCMFGSRRRKATRLMHLCPEMQRMNVSCDSSHEHDP